MNGNIEVEDAPLDDPNIIDAPLAFVEETAEAPNNIGALFVVAAAVEDPPKTKGVLLVVAAVEDPPNTVGAEVAKDAPHDNPADKDVVEANAGDLGDCQLEPNMPGAVLLLELASNEGAEEPSPVLAPELNRLGAEVEPNCPVLPDNPNDGEAADDAIPVCWEIGTDPLPAPKRVPRDWLAADVVAAPPLTNPNIPLPVLGMAADVAAKEVLLRLPKPLSSLFFPSKESKEEFTGTGVTGVTAIEAVEDSNKMGAAGNEVAGFELGTLLLLVVTAVEAVEDSTLKLGTDENEGAGAELETLQLSVVTAVTLAMLLPLFVLAVRVMLPDEFGLVKKAEGTEGENGGVDPLFRLELLEGVPLENMPVVDDTENRAVSGILKETPALFLLAALSDSSGLNTEFVAAATTADTLLELSGLGTETAPDFTSTDSTTAGDEVKANCGCATSSTLLET